MYCKKSGLCSFSSLVPREHLVRRRGHRRRMGSNVRRTSRTRLVFGMGKFCPAFLPGQKGQQTVRPRRVPAGCGRSRIESQGEGIFYSGNYHAGMRDRSFLSGLQIIRASWYCAFACVVQPFCFVLHSSV
jgi:hypothetical protein